MNRIVTDMEAKEQKTPRSENSTELTECPRHVTSRNVNDGVKGSDTSPSPIGYVQRHHVALPELDAGSQAVRALDQLGREVDATNLNPVLVQVKSALEAIPVRVRAHAAFGGGRNSLGRRAADCGDRRPWRASGNGRSPSGGETAWYRGHCGAHIGSLSAVGGSKEGPSVCHPALHVLTEDLGDRFDLKVWPTPHCRWTLSQKSPLDTKIWMSHVSRLGRWRGLRC